MNDTATKEAVSVGGLGGGGGDQASFTNDQKDGVDESDIVKNDGQYVYYVDAQQNHKIHILSVGPNGQEVGTITLKPDMWNVQIFVYS